MLPRLHHAPARCTALLLASAAVLSLGGCGGSESGTTTNSTANSTVATGSETAGSSASPTATQPSRPSVVATTTAITGPVPGRVAVQETVTGTAAGITPGRQLWLVVWPKSQNRYHPQPGPIEVNADGTWKAPAYFGEANTPKGTQFTLMLVEAAPDASAAFSQYLDDADSVRTYRGMATLPGEARVLVRLAYVRR